jgi:hypothetical protein
MAKRLTEAEFKKLGRREKAITVAHDVIAQIRLKNMNITEGSYLELGDDLNLDMNAPAKENICEIGKACYVCAKGALFLATIGRANKATVQDVLNAGESIMVHRMVRERIFTQKQLDLIEYAFEVWGADSFDPVEVSAYQFGLDFESPDHRLVAIMLNVIRNNGTFKPSDKVTQSQVNEAVRVRGKKVAV